MRQVFVLGGLLGVALVASYMTWSDDGTGDVDPGEVLVYHADPGDVSRVVWTSEKLDVELRPSTDEKGDYVMVHITERRDKTKPKSLEPPKPEGEEGADDEGDAPTESTDAGDAPAEVETTVTYFKGNDAANDLLKSLAPLVAMRELNPDPSQDASVFGFDAPSGKLVVHRKSGEVSLDIGGETFGAKDRYVRMDGRVWLVDDQTLRPIQYGKTRLVERNLQPIAEKDMDQIVVSRGDQSVTLLQKNKDDRTKAFWADAASPDTEHEVAGTWLGKVFKMRAKDFVEPADLPALTPMFTYSVKGGDQTWTVHISQDATDPKKYFAESDFLRSTVELTGSLASDAIDDLGTLLP